MLAPNPRRQAAVYSVSSSENVLQQQSRQEPKGEDARGAEQVKKVEQLREFCKNHGIEYTEADNRSDLLKKVRRWRKSKKQIGIGSEEEAKIELPPFEPPDIQGIQATVEVVSGKGSSPRSCCMKTTMKRPRVMKPVLARESQSGVDADTERKDDVEELRVRYEAQLLLSADKKKSVSASLRIIPKTVSEMEATFKELSLGADYELVVTCTVTLEGKEEHHSCKVSYPSSCQLLSQPRGEDSDQSRPTFRMPALAPLCPSILSLVSAKKRSIKVGWQGCPCSGGKPILNYIAQWRVNDASDDEFAECYQGKKSAFELTKLSPGEAYVVRVRAVNAIGSSEWSPATSFITAPAAPSSPGSVRHVHGHKQTPTELYVEWDRPKETYGVEILAYRVEMRLNDEDYRIVSNGIQDVEFPERCRITSGLHPACSATFRVIAINEAGASPPSPEVLLATLGDITSPPRSLTAVVDKASNHILLKWKGPDKTNGSKVTAYRVEVVDSGPQRSKPIEIFVDKGSVNQCSISTLQRGKRYKVRAFAQNGYGWSKPSEPCIVQVDATPPSALETPAVAIVDKDQSTVCLEWDAATEDTLNGAKLERYEAVLKKVELVLDPVPSSGLEPDLPSNVEEFAMLNPAIEVENESDDVLAESEFSVGNIVEAVYAVDGLYYLGKVRGVRRKGRSFEYEVEFSGYGNVEWVEERGLRRRLEIGDTCTALNYADQQPLSATVTAVSDDNYFVKFTARALPIQETRIQDIRTISPGMSPVQNKPIQSSAEVETHERVSQTNKNDTKVVYKGRASQCKVTLEPGCAYEARIRVVTTAGISPLSPLTSFQTQGAPPKLAKPRVLRVSRTMVCVAHGPTLVTSTAAIEEWRVSVAACRLVKARLRADDSRKPLVRAKLCGSYEDVKVVTKEGKVVVNGLQSGKCYAIRSRGHNRYGAGAWSEPVVAKTDIGTPLQPSSILLSHVEKTREFEVVVNVREPAWNGGCPITGYMLEIRVAPPSLKEQRSVRSLEQPKCTLSNIPAGATVSVRAQAKNHIGAGAYSAAQSIQLPIVLPGEVEDFAFKSTGSNTAKCTWRRPAFKGGGAILGYEAQVEQALEDPDSAAANGEEARYLVPPSGFDPDNLNSDLRYASKNFLHVKAQQGCNALFCRVRAINKRGAGPFNAWRLIELKRATKRVEMKPPSIQIVSFSPLKLKWEAEMKENGVGGVSFLVEFKDVQEGKKFRQLYRGSESSFVFATAEAGHSYVFRVRYISKEGSSPFSSCVSAKIAGRSRANTPEGRPTTTKLHKTKSRRTTTSIPKEGPSVERETEKSKLVDPQKALRWRRMRWYRRYPVVSIPLFLLACFLVLKFCLFVYYA